MQVANLTVTTLGTAFDVRTGPNDTVVMVSEGRVSVAPSPAQSPGDAGVSTETVHAGVGQRVTFSRSAQRFSVANTDPDGAGSWRNGTLQFVSEPLEDVVSAVNRYSSRHVTISAAFKETRFTGTLSPPTVRPNGSTHWSKFMTSKWSIKDPMKYLSARGGKMAPRNNRGTSWFLMILVMTIAGPVRGDDALDRDVHFHIPASPLASALIEFSTQSGIRVAAADATISNLNSDGLSGTYSIHSGLSALLQGTGLEFSRVGTQTVAIRMAPVGPKIATLAAAEGTAGVAKKTSPPESPPLPAGNYLSAATEMPDVTVIASRPPTREELAGNSLEEFIQHHDTTHFLNTSVTSNLARWRGGACKAFARKRAG